MTLVLPTVSVTAGPTWATNLNTLLELVDAHDHSSGKGVKVTPAGMNINATLEFNSQDATEVNSLSMDTRLTAPSTSRAIYTKSGDLYYKNNSGVEVQVTNGSTIAGTQGSITNLGDGGSSAVFSDLNEDFTWYFNGTKLAAQNTGDIRLYPFDGSAAYTNAVTLKSPTSLAASYSLTLPGTAPTQAGVVSVSTAGVMSYGLAAGTAGAPSLAFNGDADTGLYRVASDDIGFAAGGALVAKINASGVYAPNGTVSSPGIGFLNDGDTGIYQAAASTGSISFAANGNQILQLTATEALFPLGSAAGPSISFLSDSNTGMYQDGADALGFSCGGTRGLSVTATQVQMPGTLDIAGGGAFKVKIITVGTSSATADTLSTAHGLTLANIITVIGGVYDASISRVYGTTFNDPGTAGTLSANYFANSTDVVASFSGASGGSKVFKAYIIYQ